jgi:subtilase family serine protease
MKLKKFVIPFAFSLLSSQIYAMPGYVPPHWQAHPPIHIQPGQPTLAPSGHSPAQIIKAYGFPTNAQGAGQVIAIVDAYDNPNAEADLNVFSSTFGLPACTTANGCFKKVYTGSSTPAGNTQWGLETSLDIQWAHAIAPQAKIVLIEANDDSMGLYNAINVAIQNNATVISCSWGGIEFNGEDSLDYIFANSKVPIIVASGDSGAGVNYPAASPYVLSVGGTYLTFDSSGNYANETAWSGSGGGLSAYEKVPAFQSSFPIPQNPTNARGVPDVSMIAAPASGVSIYDSYGHGGWMVVGGTSIGAPIWAAMIAVANSAGTTNVTSSTLNKLIYNAATSSYSTMFNDITSGTNGSCGYYCQATAGYDYVTGIGTPKVSALLVYLNNPGTTCVRANPTVSYTIPNQSGPAGGMVNYTFNIKNNDSASCSYSPFVFSSSLSGGLTGSMSQNSILLAPSASGAATLHVSSTGAAAGTYAISTTAVNNVAQNYSATAAGTYGVGGSCVRAAPVVTISPASQSTTGLKPVNYTVTIQNRDSAACGYSIFGFSANSNPYGMQTFMEPYNLIAYPGLSYTSQLTVTPTAKLPVTAYAILVTGGAVIKTQATATLNYLSASAAE